MEETDRQTERDRRERQDRERGGDKTDRETNRKGQTYTQTGCKLTLTEQIQDNTDSFEQAERNGEREAAS